MKYTALKIPFFLLACLLLPLTAQAEPCNPQQPSFTVDGIEQWQPKLINEIFEQSSKQSLENSKQSDAQGISIKALIALHSKQGNLIISTCSGKSISIAVQDLFSDDPEMPQYYLALTNKNFFKLIKAVNSKPVLKAISELKLTTK